MDTQIDTLAQTTLASFAICSGEHRHDLFDPFLDNCFKHFSVFVAINLFI